MSTTTTLDTLTINYLTQAQYDAAKSAGTLDENQIYMTPGPQLYQATGASNTSTSLTADTVTQVPLVSTGAISVGDGFSISDGGIKCSNAGTYKVSGSVYISAPANNAVRARQAFIRVGSAFSSATEVHAVCDAVTSDSATRQGGISLSPKLVNVTAGQNIYLACRTTNGAGAFYAGNTATFLLVERIS